MAQPPLSRAIARLERQLGVTLLERTSRKVTLTGAGAVLLSEGRVILSAVAAAERRTQQAARRRPRLVLVVKCGTAGELLAALLDAYRAESGAATVDPTVGLDTETLHTEGRWSSCPPRTPRRPGPDGSYPKGPGAEVRNLTQLFQLIALGRTTVVVPESAGTDLRRDLTAVPVQDAPPVTTVIARPSQSGLRAVADLIRVATRDRGDAVPARPAG